MNPSFVSDHPQQRLKVREAKIACSKIRRVETTHHDTEALFHGSLKQEHRELDHRSLAQRLSEPLNKILTDSQGFPVLILRDQSPAVDQRIY